MPTYEYRCQKGHDFEVMRRMSDDPLIECEVCGAPVQRVFSAPAVHFKGTGFYSTDYGSKSRARERDAESKGGDDSSSSSGGDSSSDSTKSDSTKSDSAKSDSKSTAKKASAAAAAD